MNVDSHIKCQLFLSGFNQTSLFSTDFSKVPIKISMKIHPLVAKMFHMDGWMDGRRDMTKLRVTFHNCCHKHA